MLVNFPLIKAAGKKNASFFFKTFNARRSFHLFRRCLTYAWMCVYTQRKHFWVFVHTRPSWKALNVAALLSLELVCECEEEEGSCDLSLLEYRIYPKHAKNGNPAELQATKAFSIQEKAVYRREGGSIPRRCTPSKKAHFLAAGKYSRGTRDQ